MTLSMMKPIAFAALLTAGTAFAQPVAAQSPAQTLDAADAGLAAATLFEGESVRAIALLRAELEEHPGDPALLINLGIAYAQGGNDAEARQSFESAMASRDMIELETANGGITDSRRLARRALSMLDRGEFRTLNVRTEQFSLNQ